MLSDKAALAQGFSNLSPCEACKCQELVLVRGPEYGEASPGLHCQYSLVRGRDKEVRLSSHGACGGFCRCWQVITRQVTHNISSTVARIPYQ